ncbi:Bug family tripartite tricarboxylate transporter substrate binding protein [Microvirga antarctica]|uniref:Bug family tripartite tricarboxylate transporter substrate binding protein n=1 Tax=Microvirga antarctica TaxID=2819233 RepID=UPI001B30996F|nr:tripartite tricarboxylate transporter substrate binding protein [Microvirga antarctica]
MLKFTLLGSALALLLQVPLAPAMAEFKPTRPIEIVVHGGPGSGNDLFARSIIAIVEQEKLAPVRMQVANKPGGGSTTASAYLASKKGDPHTIGVFTNIWLTDPLLQEEANNPLTSMTPIARMLVEPALLVVKADSPYKSLQDLINAAKEKPGQIKQSGGSITARENIIRQLIAGATGARWSFISFPSGGERLAALLGGHVDLMILEPGEANEQIRSGKLRVLAQVAETRLETFKDAPTLREAGVSIPNVPQTRGIVAPPAVSEDSAKYYEDLMARVVKTEAWKKYLETNFFDGSFANSKDTREFLVSYQDDIRGYLKESGAKVVR